MQNQLGVLVRYAINGIVATGVHYAFLVFGLKVLDLSSAGLANAIAATVGIAASFLGSRYFVFRNTAASIVQQAIKFSSLYFFIAILHGFILLIWTDVMKFDYRFGFLIATCLQMSLSYLGSRRLVFKL